MITDINDPKHPCYGKDCSKCMTCKYDKVLFPSPSEEDDNTYLPCGVMKRCNNQTFSCGECKCFFCRKLGEGCDGPKCEHYNDKEIKPKEVPVLDPCGMFLKCKDPNYENCKDCACNYCKDLTTCNNCDIFNLYKRQDEKEIKEKKMGKKLCNGCSWLLRDILPKENPKFDACCLNEIISSSSGHNRFKLIRAGVGPMLDIERPEWCHLNSKETKEQAKRPLTYTEKQAGLKNLERMIPWDDISEGTTYVIPKILYQPRRIVKVLTKTPFLVQVYEIDSHGERKYKDTSLYIYKNDIEALLITKKRNF